MNPKDWVKRRYGAIAVSQGEACCEDSCCCEVSQASSGQVDIGYSSEELSAVPDGSNLGLGCGNPLALLQLSPGEVVLDLGCGAGFDAFLAADRIGPNGRVIGVDITPEMIEAARANADRANYSNVEFRLGDIENLPIEDDSVDLVISNCVLNLVPDKFKAFREILRVLKPGGRVAISDIVLEGALPEELRDDENGYCSCISGAINRGEYLAKLAQAGLSDIVIVSEMDAAPILAGDCCGDGAIEVELTGVATSINYRARKPSLGETP